MLYANGRHNHTMRRVPRTLHTAHVWPMPVPIRAALPALPPPLLPALAACFAFRSRATLAFATLPLPMVRDVRSKLRV